MPEEAKIKIEFNGREVTAPAGVTVHRAAEMNDIYIPTLCSHKDLSPYGGCRLCIVEIEGMRGYPLSCNTTAQDGMKVLTDTVAIREMRRDLLQLILSEHPSSCLVCDEADECVEFQGTVRKSGVTTGCRYCPNDSRCELQKLVEEFGITEINYPILYRGFEPERNDPFYDRDYNLCILCGRCVRMCQEMRGTGILAFNYRGPKAIVGPAFGRNHVEAGCEFCGACVSVCPTGALSEKASKWDGEPDASVTATCPYCAIGCQIELWHKDGRFSMALPISDPEVNDGQACVKGRFCLGEVSHHFSRARKPMIDDDGFWKEIPWDEAAEMAAEKVKDLNPGEFAILVSPDLDNESLYAAQKFARAAIGTNSIDSVARRTLSGHLGMWADLFSKPVSINEIKNASKILAVTLDTRFSFSIIGVEIRKAMQKGAELVTIGPRESNLARYASKWLQTAPGFEGDILHAIASGNVKDFKKVAKAAGIDPEDLKAAYEILTSGEELMVIIGPSVFRYSDIAELVKGISALSMRKNTSIIPLYNGTNTRGAIEMGTFPEFLPGAAGSEGEDAIGKFEKAWKVKLPDDSGITVDDLIDGKVKPKVLWLVGAAPFFERPECDYLIVQDIYEPDFGCDLFLPATSFLESSGTLINVEGRVQEAPVVEELPDSVKFGRARPDWWIFSEVAKKLGSSGFKYKTAEDVQKEIAKLIPDYPKPGKIDRKKRVFEHPASVPVPADEQVRANASKGKYLLVLRPENYAHRGISITSKVEGLQVLDLEHGFYLNDRDAESLGVAVGDVIEVKAKGAKGIAPVKIERELPGGVIYLYIPDAYGGLQDRKGLEQLFNLEINPVPVEVKKSAL